jgi:N-acetylmuramic acid 6-phosphate etherase
VKKITEESSLYDNLESMDTLDILYGINNEDKKVALAVEKVIPEISRFVDELVPKMKEGGRLFYIGAGTSGRLGILDASECPPTYGVSHDMVIGLIAGGDKAIRKAVEHAEDDTKQAWKDLLEFDINEMDTIVGIAASGTTPYVVGGLADAQNNNITTAGLGCNPGAPIFDHSDYVLLAEVGPEFITGSTRMKSGTAQKMILNMITTSTMVRLGKVKGNKMVDMQLSNAKLVQRGIRMIVEETGLNYHEAQAYLTQYGNVREAINRIHELIEVRKDEGYD